MNETTLKSLKLDNDLDGITFSIQDKNPNNVKWNFTMMTLADKQSQNFHHSDMGYKYQIVLYEDDYVDYFEAIIGDLNHYVKNLISANQEGIILKKCSKSEEILNKIFRGRLMAGITSGLMQVAAQKN